MLEGLEPGNGAGEVQTQDQVEENRDDLFNTEDERLHNVFC